MARSKLPTAGQIPLAHYFECTYLPIKLRSRAAGYADLYRGAINWLRKSLRREPLVADLTRRQLAACFKTMTAAGIGGCRLSEVRKRLSQLWQFAHRIGQAGPVDVPKLGKPGAAPVRQWEMMEPAPGTLLAYYRNEFRPKLLLEADAKQLSYFDSATNHFHDMSETHVVLDTITEATLADFFAALVRTGKNEDDCKKLRGAIARIVRTIDPQRFAVLPGPAPKLLAGERVKRIAEPPAEKGTLRFFYENTYLPERLIGASRHTLLAYPQLFRLLRSFLGREALLTDLNDATAAAFLNWSADVGEPGTVNNRRARLLTLWRMAHDRDLVTAKPRVRKLATSREEPDAWTPEEVGRLVAATSRLERKAIFGIPAGPYWRAALLVLWYTAMRRRSLFSIRTTCGDVDLNLGTVYVRAAGVKTKKGKRYKIGPDAVEAIRAIWDPEREKLFPQASHPNEHFAELIRLAGLPDSAHHLNQMHKLRRSTATAVAAVAGVAGVQKLLDHNTGEMSRRYIATGMLPANDATQLLPKLTPST